MTFMLSDDSLDEETFKLEKLQVLQLYEVS